MRVAIGPSSFAEADPTPLTMLSGRGIEVIPNEYGRRLGAEEITRHLIDAVGLIAGLEPLSREVLGKANKLRAIARVGVGLDTVDLEAAQELGISVSSTPGPPAAAVAEATVGAMVALCRSMHLANAALHAGRWEKIIGRSLAESVVLIVGFGRIGQRVAKLLNVLGAEILVCDPKLDRNKLDGVTETSLEQGLARADVVTLHAAGADTILDARAFEQMRSGALLLNSARGGLVDEPSLVAALEEGRVAGAWLDVFSTEPYNGPLLDFDQVILTPHTATYTRLTRREMEIAAVENLIRDLLPQREPVSGAPTA